MEESNIQTTQSKLSRTSAYLLGMAQVKGNALQQQILLLLSSKYSLNEVKRLIKTGDYIIETLYSVLAQVGLSRSLIVIQRVFQSMNRLCNNLVQGLQATKNQPVSFASQKNQSSLPPHQNLCETKEQITMTQGISRRTKTNKLGGIYLYNQDYKRKIDQQINHGNDGKQKKNRGKEKQKQMDQKDFKKDLFQKMKDQLKQVQQDLYSPFPDQISTFIIFERKLLQTFNHLSYAEDIQTMVNYLQSSNVKALQFINKTVDMTEEISKFKIQIQMLVNDAKNKNQQRNQNISQKFQIILDKFIKKRVQIYQKTSQKLKQYIKLKKQRQKNKISIGTETLQKQFQSVKNLQKQVISLQQKYNFISDEKDKAYKSLLVKADNEKHILQLELIQSKTAQKNLSEQINEMKKQYNKLIQAIYQRKNNVKNIETSQKSIFSKKKITTQSNINEQNQNFNNSIHDSQSKPSIVDRKKKDSKIFRLSNIQKIDHQNAYNEQNGNILTKDKAKKIVSIAQDGQQDAYLSQKKTRHQQVQKILNFQNQFQPQPRKKARRMPNTQLSMKLLNRTNQNISTARQQKSVQFQKSRTQKQIYLNKSLLREQTKSQKFNMTGKNTQDLNEKQFKRNLNKSSLNQISQCMITPEQTSLKTIKQNQGKNKNIFNKNKDKAKNSDISKSSKKLKIVENQNEKQNKVQHQNNAEGTKKIKYVIDKLKTTPSANRQYLLPYLPRSKNKSLAQKQKIKLLQKSVSPYKYQSQSHFSCRRVFDISFNNGNIVRFQKQDQGQKNTSIFTQSSQVIKQLKMYDKICPSKQINNLYFKDRTQNKQCPNHRKQLKSLHLSKEKLQMIQVDHESLSIADFILRVKSLMRNSCEDKTEENNLVLNKKQLIKKLLIEGIRNRHINQSFSLHINKGQQNQPCKQSKVKLKQCGQKLRKTRKKKERIDNGYRQLRQIGINESQKLPQIIVKPIFDQKLQ